MATLHVRNVPDELYEELRARAESNGRSIGAETIQLLEAQLAAPGSLRVPWLRARRRQGRGRFTRFTGLARQAVVAARDEARALGHDAVGTEHLLLGVLAVEGVGGRVLGQLGLELEQARGEVERRAGRGPAATAGALPFRADAKKALELALREALGLRHDFIGTEHVLLGVAAEAESLGAALVRERQPDTEALRVAVRSAAGVTVASASEVAAPEFRVVELEGGAEAWEAALNDAASVGYELVEIVDRRAIFRCA